MTSDEAAEVPATSWREQAVSRSLDSAWTRAEQRVQRFLDAALELMSDGDSDKEFTVQELVERSGQSLRSFYQYFAGKHELLLALFEESVRWSVDHVRTTVEQEHDPFERLHLFVVEYYRICRSVGNSKAAKQGPSSLVMVDFAQQLLTRHPAEAARAFAPLVAFFEEVLDDAAATGSIRSGLVHGPLTGVVLEAIMFNTFSATIGGTSLKASTDPAEDLWDLIVNGIGADNGSARPRRHS